MLMSLYHKKVSYACYAHAYVRTERYAYDLQTFAAIDAKTFVKINKQIFKFSHSKNGCKLDRNRWGRYTRTFKMKSGCQQVLLVPII